MDKTYILIGESGGHDRCDPIVYKLLLSSLDKNDLQKYIDEHNRLVKLKPIPQNLDDIYYSHWYYNTKILWDTMDIIEVTLI